MSAHKSCRYKNDDLLIDNKAKILAVAAKLQQMALAA